MAVDSPIVGSAEFSSLPAESDFLARLLISCLEIRRQAVHGPGDAATFDG